MRDSYSRNDRRNTPRLQIPFQIKFRPVKAKSQWKSAESRDISSGGVGFYTDESLKLGDKIDVAIYIGDSPKPFIMTCRLIWLKADKKGRFRAGLKFIMIRHHVKFVNFLCEKILEISSGYPHS